MNDQLYRDTTIEDLQDAFLFLDEKKLRDFVEIIIKSWYDSTPDSVKRVKKRRGGLNGEEYFKCSQGGP